MKKNYHRYSNTTNVKVKPKCDNCGQVFKQNSNTTNVKVKRYILGEPKSNSGIIQIQPMLRLNAENIKNKIHQCNHSNTTNVKVKLRDISGNHVALVRFKYNQC